MPQAPQIVNVANMSAKVVKMARMGRVATMDVMIWSVDMMIGRVRGTASRHQEHGIKSTTHHTRTRAPPTTREQEHRPPQDKQAIHTSIVDTPHREHHLSHSQCIYECDECACDATRHAKWP